MIIRQESIFTCHTSPEISGSGMMELLCSTWWFRDPGSFSLPDSSPLGWELANVFCNEPDRLWDSYRLCHIFSFSIFSLSLSPRHPPPRLGLSLPFVFIFLRPSKKVKRFLLMDHTKVRLQVRSDPQAIVC